MKKKKLAVLFPLALILIAGLIWIVSRVVQHKGIVRSVQRNVVPGPGSAAKSREHKWAVIVGVNGYVDTQVGKLKYAVNDAQKLYELLIDPNFGGFEKEKVKLLTDDTEDKPTRKNILIALNGLENARSEDTIFIFFSGHGIDRDDVSYFLPIDADMSILADSAISVKRFQQPMDETDAKIQVMFFDACHSGADTAASKGFRAMGENMHDLIHKHAKGRAILSSCGLNEVSWEYDEQENGVFTYFLLEALKGAADGNGDGMVSVTEASNYTTDKVMTWSFKKGRKQNPQRNVSVTGEIILTKSRSGKRLKELKKERKALEAELAKIREERRRAEQENNVTALAEAKRHEAELAEKVRQAEQAEAAERIRQQEAKQQREEAERRRREQAKIDAAKREKARREQAEIERKLLQLEQERERMAAAQTDTLTSALAKAKEIKKQISAVRPKVKKGIDEQIAAVPKPQEVKIEPKGEFEKQMDYQARVQEAKKQEAEAKRRYEQEIEQIRSKLNSEVDARKKGYEDALELLEQDFVLDETQVIFDIGRYDAEKETFPDATIRPKESSTFSDFSWNFAVPIDQAKQLKKSVLGGAVKIRGYVHLDTQNCKAEIAKVLIEDLVQEKQFGYPTPCINVTSEPSGATVRIDGREVGTTPYEGRFAPGQHKIQVGGQIYKPIPSRTVTVDIGGRESLSFKLTIKPEIAKIPDGMKMVYIPAGEFEMGGHHVVGHDDEKPVHTVYLDAFYMDKYEVTNAQYAKFLNEYGKNQDSEGHELLDIGDRDCLIEKSGGTYRAKYSGYENHPVTDVSWYGANAYAEYYGKRLPTEAEWEKAARGGLVGKRYPWGDVLSHDDANYYGTGGTDQWNGTSPVGSFPPNGYGLYDMAGNIQEWCNDWYDSNYYSSSPYANPRGPSTGRFRLLRGGSWALSTGSIRVAYRNLNTPYGTFNYYGFRCCVSQDFTP